MIQADGLADTEFHTLPLLVTFCNCGSAIMFCGVQLPSSNPNANVGDESRSSNHFWFSLRCLLPWAVCTGLSQFGLLVMATKLMKTNSRFPTHHSNMARHVGAGHTANTCKNGSDPPTTMHLPIPLRLALRTDFTQRTAQPPPKPDDLWSARRGQCHGVILRVFKFPSNVCFSTRLSFAWAHLPRFGAPKSTANNQSRNSPLVNTVPNSSECCSLVVANVTHATLDFSF